VVSDCGLEHEQSHLVVLGGLRWHAEEGCIVGLNFAAYFGFVKRL